MFLRICRIVTLLPLGSSPIESLNGNRDILFQVQSGSLNVSNSVMNPTPVLRDAANRSEPVQSEVQAILRAATDARCTRVACPLVTAKYSLSQPASLRFDSSPENAS